MCLHELANSKNNKRYYVRNGMAFSDIVVRRACVFMIDLHVQKLITAIL